MRTRTTSERANVAVAKRIWMATADGDATALEAILSEGVVWKVHGHNFLAGEYRGREAVIGTIADFGEQMDDLRLSLKDVYASSHGAVISYDLWARRGTNELESEVLVRLRIEDGLVAGCDVVPMDQAALDAFLSWIH